MGDLLERLVRPLPRWGWWSLGIAGGCGCSCLAVAVLFGLGLFAFVRPTNTVDNADPNRRAEMVRLTLEWGRLAPFPPSARGFRIRTEGNMFTRTFRSEFSAPPADIEHWLRASPGTAEAEPFWRGRGMQPNEETGGSSPREVRQYEIKPGGEAGYALVTVDELTSTVSVRVSWS